jgi:hypothetical protein
MKNTRKKKLRSPAALQGKLRRLAALLLLGSAPALAQTPPSSIVQVGLEGGAIVLQGPLSGDPLGNSLAFQPLTDIDVSMYYVHESLPTSYSLVQTTDGVGRIMIPPGYLPIFGTFDGPSGPKVSVFRYWATPTDPPIHEPVQTRILLWFGDEGPAALAISLTGDITANELSVFRHVHDAHAVLESFFGFTFFEPVIVEFYPFNPWPGGPASYASHTIKIHQALDPTQAPAGLSPSVLAHESAHRFINNIYIPPERLDEAFADFLASRVTGSSLIGYSDRIIRDVDTDARWYPTLDEEDDPHEAGLPLAGALFHTRQLSRDPARFDLHVRGVIEVMPRSEEEVLQRLLGLDDDDSDLANGTPSMAVLYAGFTARHGIPWPLDVVPAGWSARGNPPLLTGAPAGSVVELHLSGAPPLATGAVLGSADPVHPTVLPSGRSVYLDPATVVRIAAVASDAEGRASITVPVPAGLHGDFALSAVIETPGGPYRAEVSNGLRIRL